MDDGRTKDSYSDPMSETILGHAADVLRSFGSAFGGRHLAIVGGAVPGLLLASAPVGLLPHVGTGDLDLHLSLHLLDGETAEYYDAIIDGLRGLGLAPDRTAKRQVKWRWVGIHRGVRLQVEFLCPTRSHGGRPEPPAPNTPAEVNVGGHSEIAALGVSYGHLVLEDTITVERDVRAAAGRLTYPFPVANVASWLCLKADAMILRNKPKDAYDVVWLLAGLGPDEASQRVATSPLLRGPNREPTLEQLQRLAELFASPDMVGPESFRRFVDGTARAARYAVGTVSEFKAAIEATV